MIFLLFNFSHKSAVISAPLQLRSPLLALKPQPPAHTPNLMMSNIPSNVGLNLEVADAASDYAVVVNNETSIKLLNVAVADRTVLPPSVITHAHSPKEEAVSSGEISQLCQKLASLEQTNARSMACEWQWCFTSNFDWSLNRATFIIHFNLLLKWLMLFFVICFVRHGCYYLLKSVICCIVYC